MDHRAVRQKLSEYIDDVVTDEERRAIDAHLLGCASCSSALAELKKTVGHIKRIEAVEPPPWMTSRIMAHVRAEAEKKGSGKRFFSPAVLRPAFSAVAVIFVAVVALFIYQQTRPELSFKEEAPPLPARQEFPPAKGEAPALSRERAATPAPAVPREESTSMAPAAREQAPAAQDEVKATTLRLSVKAGAATQMRQKIERAIADAGGQVIASSITDVAGVIRARIAAEKISALAQQIGRIRPVAPQPPTDGNLERIIEIRVILLAE